jgi:hypothetical protein
MQKHFSFADEELLSSLFSIKIFITECNNNRFSKISYAHARLHLRFFLYSTTPCPEPCAELVFSIVSGLRTVMISFFLPSRVSRKQSALADNSAMHKCYFNIFAVSLENKEVQFEYICVINK